MAMATDDAPKAPENDFYEIRALPGKGYGCVAIKNIPRGTRILADAPILVVTEANYMKFDIEAAFAHFSNEEKELYFTLHSGHNQPASSWPTLIHPSVTGKERDRITEQHNARTGTEATVISIFQINCMELGPGAAVFLHAARFNHACIPNACFSWNEAIGKETIHTMRDVSEGEELTISYCDMEHDKRLRSWELKHYGFVCGCEACGDEDEEGSAAFASAERRMVIRELDRETRLLRGFRLEEGARMEGFAGKLLKLAVTLQGEGFWDARLAGVFLDIAVVCEINGDYKMGLAAGEKALGIKRDCQGVDFRGFERYAVVVERIRAKGRLEGSE